MGNKKEYPDDGRTKYTQKINSEILSGEPIHDLNENDILLGRGGNNNKYVGNERLRVMAMERVLEYQVSSKIEKFKLSSSLVQKVRSSDPPGRFLCKKRYKNYDAWFDAGDAFAREKVAQVFRDAVNFIMKNNIATNDGSTSSLVRYDESNPFTGTSFQTYRDKDPTITTDSSVSESYESGKVSKSRKFYSEHGITEYRKPSKRRQSINSSIHSDAYTCESIFEDYNSCKEDSFTEPEFGLNDVGDLEAIHIFDGIIDEDRTYRPDDNSYGANFDFCSSGEGYVTSALPFSPLLRSSTKHDQVDGTVLSNHLGPLTTSSLPFIKPLDTSNPESSFDGLEYNVEQGLKHFSAPDPLLILDALLTEEHLIRELDCNPDIDFIDVKGTFI